MTDHPPAPGEEFVPETQQSLNRLSYALIAQLDSPSRETWTQLEFSAARVQHPQYGETHTLRLTVSQPQGDIPLIPRPEAIDACNELDRLSILGGRPRWRALRLLLRRVDGQVSYQCWWDYDPPHKTSSQAGPSG